MLYDKYLSQTTTAYKLCKCYKYIKYVVGILKPQLKAKTCVIDL